MSAHPRATHFGILVADYAKVILSLLQIGVARIEGQVAANRSALQLTGLQGTTGPSQFYFYLRLARNRIGSYMP